MVHCRFIYLFIGQTLLENLRPKSIAHIRAFSDNGVYVALQYTSIIVVSDK